MSIEGFAVLPKRDLIDAPHCARQHRIQIAPESFQNVRDLAGDAEHVVPVNLPRVRASAVFRGIPIEPLAGLFVLVEEMALDAVEHPAREARRRDGAAGNRPHAGGEDDPSTVLNRPVREKSFDAAGQTGEHTTEPLERVRARHLGGEVARARRKRAIDRIVYNQPPIDHVREAIPQPLLAELRKQQADVVVCSRKTAPDVERLIERLLHQTRHLRLVGHLEAGIEVGLERELAKQRQAERIDGADVDVAGSIAHVAPELLVRSSGIGPLSQLVEDAASHLGSGFPRKRNRKDVRRLDAAAQQVEIPVDEHMSLASPG